MNIDVLGVPLDLGQSRRGVDMGPSAIRSARLHDELRSLGHDVHDLGNLPNLEREEQAPEDSKLKYLEQVLLTCKRVAKIVQTSAGRDHVPLVLGGDHSIALGTVAGLVGAGRRPSVLWVDAHGDFNTHETTPSGNIHGMPLAALTGLGHPSLVGFGGEGAKVPPERVALIGVRDLDEGERDNILESGVHYATMRDIDERGIKSVLDDALQHVARSGSELHVSFDVDVMDPNEAPGTGTPVPGGLSYREAHLVMETVGDTGTMRSLEFVEVNPLLDEANRTGALAVQLIASAFGKRIIGQPGD